MQWRFTQAAKGYEAGSLWGQTLVFQPRVHYVLSSEQITSVNDVDELRAYQLQLEGKPGPWLAGMTLDPAATPEAWCHQRGYVCFIQELHGRKVKAGETLGAAYSVGYFDDTRPCGHIVVAGPAPK